MTQKFYVTLTWHDWPDGGSYATVVEAPDYDEAHLMALEQMAVLYAQEIGHESVNHLDYGWYLVDCYKIADFYNHPEAIRLLNSLLDRDDLIIDSVAADVVEQIKALLV